MERFTEKIGRNCGAKTYGRRLLPVFALVLSLILSGCGSKTINADDPFTASPNVPRSPVFLPDDDGRPLTAAEKKAFLSTGDFDRNLSSADMEDVLRHYKNLVHSNRRTVEVAVARANTHINYMRQVFRENGIPAELAYLPFVESTFNSMAVSPSGALGMWQFMPRTGRYYGLQQDSWRDERRDPMAATRSAAAYLKKLNNDFNDWHLAVSAYNAGEGKIGRGLSATGAKSFFELRKRDAMIAEQKDKMTEENKQYLPKFLAVCKIMRNLETLGFTPLRPVSTDLRQVPVQPGTDLLALSRALDMSWDQFMTHNSAFLRYLSPPDYSSVAYVPSALENRALAFLRTAPVHAKDYAKWRPYRIEPGDTLSAIVRKNGVNLAEVEKANPHLGTLRPGHVILLPPAKPKAQAKASALAKTSTARAEKDSGKRDSGKNSGNATTVAQNTKATAQNSKVVAQNARNTTPAVKSASQTAPAKGGKGTSYQVQQGDTLWAIARKFNVPPHDLLAFNGMDMTVKLKPGDVVMVQR